MKKIISTFVAACMAYGAFAQVNMPQPSTTQNIKQAFGMGSIELTDSRPNAKGRTVFGNLVRWGKLWRTGANNATRVKFTDVVEIGGKKIDTGSYAIYTIPQKNEWEIVLNKGIGNWGVDGYKESEDVVRVKVPAMKTAIKNETFTMQIANVQNESCEIHIMWENTAVAIPVKTKVKDRLKAQLDKAMEGDRKPYFQAANFYYEWEKDLTKALSYANGAIESAEKAGQKPFWMYLLKAKIQKDAGDKAGAKASAKTCVELAKAANNADYVKMGTELAASL